MDRIDLSLYPISNLPISPPIKSHESITSTTNSLNLKTKSLIITKPYEHHKSLKRLNHSETKKTSSLPPEIFKEKRNYNSISIRSSTSDATIALPKTKTNGTSTSTPAMSPIYRPKPTVQKRIGLFNKENYRAIFSFYSRNNSNQKESQTTCFTN